MDYPHALPAPVKIVISAKHELIGSPERALQGSDMLADSKKRTAFTVRSHRAYCKSHSKAIPYGKNWRPIMGDEKAQARPVFVAALNAYRDAVATRAYWEDNGSRRDGRLEAAVNAERTAKREVLRLAR